MKEYKEITKINLHFTSWDDMDDEVNKLFINLFKGDKGKGEKFYKYYFYWYNVVHELGHILRLKYGTSEASNGNKNIDSWKEEQAVNDFAVGFWKFNNQHSKLKFIRKNIEDILSLLPDPAQGHNNRKEFFTNNYAKFSPLEYGYFQFNFVKNSFKREDSLYKIIKEHIYTNAKKSKIDYCLDYKEINEELPSEIINDMRKYLVAFGIELPKINVIKESDIPGSMVSFE